MNRFIRRVGFMASLIIVLGAGWGCASRKSEAPAPREGKTQVTRLEDLPLHTYRVEGNVPDLLASEARIRDLAEQVRADIERDMATYAVEDKTTLLRWESTLLNIDLLQGRDADALKRIERMRALEDKEAARLTSGLSTEAMIRAADAANPDENFAAYAAAYQRILREKLAQLPWEVVEDEIQAAKGQMEIISEALLIGASAARVGPALERTGELNAEQAGGILGTYVAIHYRVPLKEPMVATYRDYIAAHAKPKENIWPQRTLTLAPDENYTPVLAAVWDSGVDVSLFPGHVYENDAEGPNHMDDDANGFVDDLHGPAYDYDANRTSGDLYPLEDATQRIDAIMGDMKGFMDLRADVDSPEASALKQKISGLDQSQIGALLEDLNLAGNYAHGTHVAGIVAEGNPYVRLLNARHSYDYHLIPVARTLAWGQRDAAKCRSIVDYLKKAGVRVVNMSWGESRQDAEDSLEANGIGATAEERRAVARKVFDLQKEALYAAMKDAPEILFVCAAGNADNDVAFDEYIPSSFDLPNLITVGAVDQAGEPTSFTSFGPTVQVYANGFEVDSFVPGGKRMAMSGTSMASPNVANLAAKLLAIDPALTPPQVIEVIRKGCDERSYGERKYLLLNPQRSAELLRAEQTKKS